MSSELTEFGQVSWAPSRADADAKGGIRQIQKFSKKVMV